jgi:hypothetical protein
MNIQEATEAEEQILLIYQFVEEDRLFRRKIHESGLPLKENKVLQRLLKRKDAEEILRNCILELEEKRTGSRPSPLEFEEMMVSFDLTPLYRKYGLKGLGDIYKLDLKKLCSLL